MIGIRAICGASTRLILIERRTFFYNYWRARRGEEGAKEIRDEIKSIPLDVRLIEAYKLFKTDVVKFAKQLKHDYSSYPRTSVFHGDCTPVYQFDGTDSPLDRWAVASDAGEGRSQSWAQIKLSPNKRWLIFSGNLDGGYDFDLNQAISTERNSEPIRIFGLAALIAKGDRMPFRMAERPFEWSMYTHLGIRLRGDGRCYILMLNRPGYLKEFAHEAYTYPIHTRGGPYWQDVRIPFAKFAAGNKGFLNQTQTPNRYLSSVTGITLSLMDRVSGPFKLEIESVYVIKDSQLDLEKSAYETYRVPPGVF